jgi:hypothetical protein
LAGIPIVGPALGAVAAGAAVVAGIANVKKILAVDSGLPGGSSVSASTPSAANAAPTPQRPGAVAPTLNQGIISRDALSNITVAPTLNQGIISRDALSNITDNQVNVQPTLVIDDVTNAQNSESANSTTSVI